MKHQSISVPAVFHLTKYICVNLYHPAITHAHTHTQTHTHTHTHIHTRSEKHTLIHRDERKSQCTYCYAESISDCAGLANAKSTLTHTHTHHTQTHHHTHTHT